MKQHPCSSINQNKMAKRTKKQNSALRLEALEQRQLLAGVTGAGTEVGTDIHHPNGNIYDQVLLTGGSVSVTADAGQITRVSFIDTTGDIVQAEFAGKGTLTVAMADGYATNVAPSNYVQSGVSYVQGLASFTITGADASTNFTVFSVGSSTATNQSLFDSTHTGGDHYANVQRITIVADTANPNGSTFGGIRAGNAIFSGDSGVTGITAADVQVQSLVRIGDIDAKGTATPALTFGTSSQFGSVDVSGGDLLQTNGKSINNSGSYGYQVNFVANTDSAGNAIAAGTVAPGTTFTDKNPLTGSSKTFNLTTSVDTIVGTAGDDTINGQLGAGATLTGLDSVDGGAGSDTINLSDVTGAQPLPGGLTLKNIETLNFGSTGAATVNTTASGITGVKTLNVTTSTGADVITVASDTAVTVFDSAGTVSLTGGTTQTVTTKGGLTLSGASGAISATDLGQTSASTINGGTTVGLTNTVDASTGAPATITIGGTTVPTGAVTVTDTITGDKANDRASGLLSVKGGTTVSVAVTGTQGVNADTVANKTLTLPAVTVTGTTATTAVSVSGESAAVTATTGVAAVAATGQVTESATVQFATLTAGQTIVLGGITYTAPTGGATAKQVASAFSNLGSNAGGAWTTAGATGSGSDTVKFTSTTANTDVADLANTGTGALAAAITKTDGAAGTAATAATAAKGGITPGLITITDAVSSGASGTISNVTLTNFAGGANITSGALSTLSLGGAGGAVAITNTAAKTLDLTLNGTTTGTTIANDTYTTIKAHTTGADSTITTLTDAAANIALTVDGTKALTITTAPTTVKTITVSGSAGLTVTSSLVGTSATDVNASATSGNVSVTLDPSATTYEGGSGSDSVTIGAVVPTKAIDGGAGSDTLTVNAASYASSSKITNFETLAVGGLANGSFNASGFTGLSMGATTGATTFTNVAAGTGLTLTASPTGAVVYTLNSDTTADAVPITLNGGSSSVTATITATKAESVSIASNGSSNTLTLGAQAELASVTVTGSKALSLTATGNTSITSVNASALTAGLTYTTAGTTAETVWGGTGANALTAAVGTTADTLVGGAAADTLTANAGLDILTGGAGNDKFVTATPGANVNTYSTVTDATAGDVIILADKGTLETFNATKVVLGDTAVFQDYANAIVQINGDASTNGKIGWFQFNGNTYVVESMHNGVSTPSFVNGTDLVVKLTGLVDLSGASLVQGGAAPEIVIR